MGELFLAGVGVVAILAVFVLIVRARSAARRRP